MYLLCLIQVSVPRLFLNGNCLHLSRKKSTQYSKLWQRNKKIEKRRIREKKRGGEKAKRRIRERRRGGENVKRDKRRSEG